MVVLGSVVYVGCGDYVSFLENRELLTNQKSDNWLLIRLMFMGLYFAVMGLTGIIAKLKVLGLVL